MISLLVGTEDPSYSHSAAQLVSAGTQGLLAGDALVVIATDGYRAGRYADGAATVEAQAHALLARFGHLSESLEQGTPARTQPEPVSIVALRGAAFDGIRRAKAGELDVRAAMAVVIAAEWVENLAWLAAHLEESVNAAAEAARIHWWR